MDPESSNTSSYLSEFLMKTFGVGCFLANSQQLPDKHPVYATDYDNQNVYLISCPSRSTLIGPESFFITTHVFT